MILKQAFQNLKRHKGTCILMALVIAIVMFVSATSSFLHTTAEQMITKQKEQIGAEVVITRNDDILESSGDLSDYRVVSIAQMKEFSQSTLLKESTLYASAAMIGNLEGVQGNRYGSGMNKDDGQSMNPYGSSNYQTPNMLLIGSSNPTINDDFKQGIRKIKEGKMYEHANEVIISETLASKNQLQVGSTIDASFFDYTGNRKDGMKLLITGIYEDHKPAGDADLGSLNKHNEVFTGYDTFEQSSIATSETGDVQVEGTFVLKNPDDLETLQKEFKEKGMPSYWELSVDESSYAKAIAPLEKIVQMTQMFRLIVICVGGMVILLLSLLAMRDRKYEIGVLRAMGMAKKKIIAMLCLESLIITLLCTVITTGIAMKTAPTAAEILLQQSEVAQMPTTSIINTSNEINPIVFETSISQEAILQICLLAIVLSAMGSICGVWYVARKEPMRILIERN